MSERADNIRSFPANGPELTAHSYYASTVTPDDVKWLSPGRLAVGKITILDGDPGVGKSMITVDLVARITTGRPLLDAPGWGRETPIMMPRGAVMLSAEDDDADTIVPRLIAAGADLKKVAFLKMRDQEGNEFLPTLGRNLAEIERLIESTNAAILVVDPLMAYLDADVKSNSDQDVRRVLTPLAGMAARKRCAVLVLRHLNKNAGMSALHRGGGSVGIVGAARIALLAAKDHDDETGLTRVLAVQKCNVGLEMPSVEYRVISVGDKGVAKIDWRGETKKGANDILNQVDASERAESSEAERWLKDFLQPGSAESSEIFRQGAKDGFTQKTLQRARIKLGIKSEKRGFGKEGAWEWQLPTAHTVHAPNGATLTVSTKTASDDAWDDEKPS